MSDLEEWRDIPGWQGYRVSNRGNVECCRKIRKRGDPGGWRRKTLTVNTHGYYQVAVCCGDANKANLIVHRLVARVFIGPRPDGMQVAHGDGNKLNNDIRNLRYATPKENNADKAEHGTRQIGVNAVGVKLTE